ncbi:MAG TPA: hypothetical protein VN808_07020 [Stellaceae bacterium]|nr:hypothetical protein [Stellaceae bacterium]
MEHADRFGLKLTAASSHAVADYVAAVDLMLSANAGAEDFDKWVRPEDMVHD